MAALGPGGDRDRERERRGSGRGKRRRGERAALPRRRRRRWPPCCWPPRRAAEPTARQRSSRSKGAEKPRVGARGGGGDESRALAREERAASAAAAALELQQQHHHHHHRHESLGLLGRPAAPDHFAPPPPPPPPPPPLRLPLLPAAARGVLLGAGAGAGPRPGTLEYKTLLISNLGSQVSDEDVEDSLFPRFGDVSVKLSHTHPELGRRRLRQLPPPGGRQGRAARQVHAACVVLLGERQLKVEPMYVRRRSVTPPELAYLPPALQQHHHQHHQQHHQHHAPYPYRQRSLSPPGPSLRARHYAALEGLALGRERERERERILDYYGMLDERGRPYGFPPLSLPLPLSLSLPLSLPLPPPPPGPVAVEDLKPEDDQRATSNLFIGNLDHNVTEVELRRAFDKYGVIEEVVIKRPARGQGGAYGFVKFQNLDMAHRAKIAMQGRMIGMNPVKIGYGKANSTTRLWVGGLGPGISLTALAREFDRFGSIRNIDYVKGDSFAYIQYESLDASQAACTQMRGFPLGGPERRLRVDFAKVEVDSPPRAFPSGYQPPPVLPLPLPPPAHYELLPEAYARHRSLEREGRARERAAPPPGPPPPPPRPRRRCPCPTSCCPRGRGGAGAGVRGQPPAPPQAWARGRRRRRGVRPADEERAEQEQEPGALAEGARGEEEQQEEEQEPVERPRPHRGAGRRRGRGTGRRSGTGAGQRSEPRRRAPCPRSPARTGRGVRAPDSPREPQDHSPEEGGAPASRPPPTPADPASTRHHSKRGVSSGGGGGGGGGDQTTTNNNNHHHHHHRSSDPSPAPTAANSSPSSGPAPPPAPPASLSEFAASRLPKAIAQRLRHGPDAAGRGWRAASSTAAPTATPSLLALQGPVDRQAPPPEPGLQVRLLRHLVNLPAQQGGGGVISLPGAMLYAFPPGPFLPAVPT
ncbi:hypothetical protein CRUP_017965 [Coryphaenoides rupestris]|nr:hypothetical protein CRUP_017965 [Coryphaenoides rupestris]